MSLIDDPLRAVSVKEIDRQEEGLGQEGEGSVSFNQEVKQVWAHVPLDFRLDVDGRNVG